MRKRKVELLEPEVGIDEFRILIPSDWSSYLVFADGKYLLVRKEINPPKPTPSNQLELFTGDGS